MITDRPLTGTAYMNALAEEWHDCDSDPYTAQMAYSALQAAAPQAAPPPRPLDAAPTTARHADPLAAARQVEGVERQVLSPYGVYMLEACEECL